MQTFETLGQYKVLEQIGSGSLGPVYRAVDPDTGSSVALKIVRRDLIEQHGASMLVRLQNEARAAACLKHPGITEVYGFTETADRSFIAMEYVDGTALPQHTQVPVADAICIAVQLLSALEYAHEKGVVHRAIRTSNLLLTKDGLLKIADFGVAEVDSKQIDSYRSPEQFMGAPVDRRSDLFSTGVILYELLTGSNPFAGPAEQILDRVCNEPETPPSKMSKGIPEQFDAIVARSLAKAVYDRYPTARIFREELQRTYSDLFHGAVPDRVSAETFQLLAEAKRSQEKAAVQAPAATKVEPKQWDPAVLREVEKQLAEFVGPLARIVVKEAAARTSDLDRLYSLASESLVEDGDRRSFLARRSIESAAHAVTSGTAEERTERLSAASPTITPMRRAVANDEQRSRGPATPAASEGGSGAAVAPRSISAAAKAEPRGNSASLQSSPPQQDARVSRHQEPRMEAPAPLPQLEKQQTKETRRPEPQRPASPPESKLPPPSTAVSRARSPKPNTLAEYLGAKPAVLDKIVHTFISVTEALAAANASGAKIDALTPESIRIDSLGGASIQPVQTGTAVSEVLGDTARYAAPEIFSDQAEQAGLQSRIYELGFMFYEILLGKDLFEKTFAEQRNDLDWLHWHADPQKKAPPLRTLLPSVPIVCSEMLSEMMEKDVSKRTRDPQVVLARLRSVASQAETTMILHKSPKLVRPTTEKRHTGRAIALIVVLVIVASAGTYLWLNPELLQRLINFAQSLFRAS